MQRAQLRFPRFSTTSLQLMPFCQCDTFKYSPRSLQLMWQYFINPFLVPKFDCRFASWVDPILPKFPSNYMTNWQRIQLFTVAARWSCSYGQVFPRASVNHEDAFGWHRAINTVLWIPFCGLPHTCNLSIFNSNTYIENGDDDSCPCIIFMLQMFREWTFTQWAPHDHSFSIDHEEFLAYKFRFCYVKEKSTQQTTTFEKVSSVCVYVITLNKKRKKEKESGSTTLSPFSSR